MRTCSHRREGLQACRQLIELQTRCHSGSKCLWRQAVSSWSSCWRELGTRQQEDGLHADKPGTRCVRQRSIRSCVDSRWVRIPDKECVHKASSAWVFSRSLWTSHSRSDIRWSSLESTVIQTESAAAAASCGLLNALSLLCFLFIRAKNIHRATVRENIRKSNRYRCWTQLFY